MASSCMRSTGALPTEALPTEALRDVTDKGQTLAMHSAHSRHKSEYAFIGQDVRCTILSCHF